MRNNLVYLNKHLLDYDSIGYYDSDICKYFKYGKAG